MVTRPSARARGAPAQVWIPCPKAMCCTRVRAVDFEHRGVVEHPRIPVARTGDQHQRGPGRDVDTTELRGDAGHPELRAQRALEPQRFLNEVRDPLAIGPHCFLEVGPLTQHPEREGQ